MGPATGRATGRPSGYEKDDVGPHLTYSLINQYVNRMATDELSRVFSALADPTRREILVRLSRGEATVGELAEPFSISPPAISRHLKVLEEAGLISRDRRAQWRTNTLRPERLREATTWMEHLSRLWDGRFDRLDAYLKSVQRTPTDTPTSTHPPTDPSTHPSTDPSTDKERNDD
jgi:DNA-binding transcriptional ArsR family regulator